MTEKELRELDDWVCKNVIPEFTYFDRPTKDPAASLEVLKKCLVKANGQLTIVHVEAKYSTDGKEFYWINDPRFKAETLEIAICKFAQKLHSK